MLDYSATPDQTLEAGGHQIASFTNAEGDNLDPETVASFGEEWTKFNAFSEEEITNAGDQYFDIVTDEMVNKDTVVLDMGCGTGRWSKYLAPRAGFIEAIDPSKAVFSAAELTKDCDNVRVTNAGVDNIPFADESFDFAMGIGVYHHIPDTRKAIKDTLKKVKPGGHFLIYLYYNLDGRSGFYKFLFSIVNGIRKMISSFPKGLKKFACDCMAIFVYMPFVLLSRFVKLVTPKTSEAYLKIPLSYYADKSWNIIRNDALDRFGTPLEQRFSKKELIEILTESGLTNIVVSKGMPYWHAVGRKG